LLGAAARLGGQARRPGSAARLFAQVPTLAKAGTELAEELARVTLGRSRMTRPNAATGRFKDPTLTGNGRQPPGGHRLMRGYLATCQASGEFDELEGI